MPRAGTKFRKLYDLLAEYPGVKCSTKEVADELGITSHRAGSQLAAMHKIGHVQKSGGGNGAASDRLWWVDA
ncbi:FaeA/PapI family transcriptional regulator [uncultured Deinococcus sp.]|uniref:FaeA/PapI family transcriptional regulator n=1 Tax=uncultured Deinococcus sp. TaxID=158789 RepID=UPI00258F592B|nr:FaeA/PapI family transcriptional regulator [uncultured Deinococcus sp.]